MWGLLFRWYGGAYPNPAMLSFSHSTLSLSAHLQPPHHDTKTHTSLTSNNPAFPLANPVPGNPKTFNR